MSNESSNLPTAAVISDRQATGGGDMATSPAYQQPVDNISKNYPRPGALAEAASNAHDGQGAWPFPRGEQAVTAVGTDSALPVHVLCHDPYAWFSQRGQRLHSVSIGILPSPRSNGVLYTGTFNIDGFIYTVGSPSIDGLYHEAMAKRCRHLQSIDRHQQSKRVRCAARYRERYPDACLPQWLAPSEN